MGCDITMPGGGLVPVSLDPVLAVHASRVMEAATRPGSVLDLDQVQTWLAGLGAKPAPAPAPASEQDKRLLVDHGPPGQDRNTRMSARYRWYSVGILIEWRKS